MIENKKIAFVVFAMCVMLIMSVSCGGNKKATVTEQPKAEVFEQPKTVEIQTSAPETEIIATHEVKQEEEPIVVEAEVEAEVETEVEAEVETEVVDAVEVLSEVVEEKTEEVIKFTVAESPVEVEEVKIEEVKEEAKAEVAPADEKKGVVMFLVAETKEADRSAEKAAAKAARDAAKAERQPKQEECDFLSRCSVSAYLSPYSFHSYAFTDNAGVLVSNYALGAKLKGRYQISNGFYAAIDVGVITAFMEKKYDGNITDVTFMAKAGYKCNFDNVADGRLFVFVETGVGLEIKAGHSVGHAYYVLPIELGAGYKLNDNWSIEATCEGTWHWMKKCECPNSCSAWGVNAYIGATYKF